MSIEDDSTIGNARQGELRKQPRVWGGDRSKLEFGPSNIFASRAGGLRQPVGGSGIDFHSRQLMAGTTLTSGLRTAPTADLGRPSSCSGSQLPSAAPPSHLQPSADGGRATSWCAVSSSLCNEKPEITLMCRTSGTSSISSRTLPACPHFGFRAAKPNLISTRLVTKVRSFNTRAPRRRTIEHVFGTLKHWMG